MSDTNDTRKGAGRKPRTRWILMGIAGLLAVAVAGMTWSAVAYSKRDGSGHGFGWFSEKKIERMLDKVAASDDQRGRVHDIVKAAVADLQEVRDLKRKRCGRTSSRRSPGSRSTGRNWKRCANAGWRPSIA